MNTYQTKISVIDPKVEESLKEALNHIVPQALGLTFHLSVTVFQDNWDSSMLSNLNHGGEVHILGDWNGSIVLRFEEALPLHLVEKLYGEECRDIRDPRVDEVVRELVNMVGGNLKSLLGEKCILSVPKSHLTGDYRGEVSQSRQWLSGLYEIDGIKLHASVWGCSEDIDQFVKKETS